MDSSAIDESRMHPPFTVTVKIRGDPMDVATVIDTVIRTLVTEMNQPVISAKLLETAGGLLVSPNPKRFILGLSMRQPGLPPLPSLVARAMFGAGSWAGTSSPAFSIIIERQHS